LRIALVDVTEETLQFTNLVISDIGPNLEDRKVRPKTSLGATVTAQSRSYPTTLTGPAESNVDDIIMVDPRTPVSRLSIKNVDAA